MPRKARIDAPGALYHIIVSIKESSLLLILFGFTMSQEQT